MLADDDDDEDEAEAEEEDDRVLNFHIFGCEQTLTKGELLTGGFGMFWLVLRNTGGARQSQ